MIVDKSLPCVKGGGTACRDGGIVKNKSYKTIPQSLRDSSLYTREPLSVIAYLAVITLDKTVL